MQLGSALSHGFNNIFNFQGRDDKDQFRQFFLAVLFVCLLTSALVFGSSFYEKYHFLEYARDSYGDRQFRNLPYEAQITHRESTVIEGLKLGFLGLIVPILLTLSAHIRRMRDIGVPAMFAILLPVALYLLPIYVIFVIVLMTKEAKQPLDPAP